MSEPILPEIDQAACDGCGQCIPVCRAGALAIEDATAVLARPDLCAYDGECEPACPQHAIQLPYLVVFGGG